MAAQTRTMEKVPRVPLTVAGRTTLSSVLWKTTLAWERTLASWVKDSL